MMKCGATTGANCRLPGALFPACPHQCTREQGHPGRCWCDFHKTNPNTVWKQEHSKEKEHEDTFVGLIKLMVEAGYPEQLEALTDAKITRPSVLRDKSVQELEALGIPTEAAQAILGKKKHIPEAQQEDAVERRQDHPHIAQGGRGSRARAEAQLHTEEQKEYWREQVRKDMYAKSSLKPRESQWETWKRAAAKFRREPLPLSVGLVIDVAAYFKAGGYRSASEIFARARQEHITEYNEVPKKVELAIAKAVRSIERGMGPAEFKDSFPVEDIISEEAL